MPEEMGTIQEVKAGGEVEVIVAATGHASNVKVNGKPLFCTRVYIDVEPTEFTTVEIDTVEDSVSTGGTRLRSMSFKGVLVDTDTYRDYQDYLKFLERRRNRGEGQ